MNVRTSLLLPACIVCLGASCQKKSEPAVDVAAGPAEVAPLPPPPAEDAAAVPADAPEKPGTDTTREPAGPTPQAVAAPAWHTPLALADAKDGAVVVWLGAADAPAAVWQPVDAQGLPNGEARPLAAVPADARALRAVRVDTGYAVGWCRAHPDGMDYGLQWVAADGTPQGDPVDLGSETPFEEGRFGGDFPPCDLDLAAAGPDVLLVRQSGETECAEETGTDEPGNEVGCPGQTLYRVARGAEPRALVTQGLLAPVGGPRSPIAVGEDAFWAATLQTAALRTRLAGTVFEGPCPAAKLDAVWGSHAVLLWTGDTLVALGDSMFDEGLHLAACQGDRHLFPPNEEGPAPIWPRVAARTLVCGDGAPKATFDLGEGRTLAIDTGAPAFSGAWRHLLRSLDGRDDPQDAAFTGAGFLLAHVGQGEEGAVRAPVTLEAHACGPDGLRL
ncbi:MAG: hypothetical protein JXB32_11960 [Deltaproteobacteria bacterium]|nr:hypothetical protein [Deltaproteobacteria bacterium]